MRAVRCWLLGVAAAAAVTAGVPPLSSVFDVVDVTLASALPGCSIHFKALLYAATLPGTLSVAGGEDDNLLSSRSHYGLSQLRCGKCAWATTTGERHLAHVVPKTAVPLAHATDFAPTALVAATAIRGFHTSKAAAARNDVGGVLILQALADESCFEDGALGDSGEAFVDLSGAAEQGLLYVDECAGESGLLDAFTPGGGSSGGGGALQREATCAVDVLDGAAGTSARRLVLQHANGTDVPLAGASFDLHHTPGWFGRVFPNPRAPAPPPQAGAGSGSASSGHHRPQIDGVPEDSLVLTPGLLAYAPPASRSVGARDASKHHANAETARRMEALRYGRSILRAAFPGLYGYARDSVAAAQPTTEPLAVPAAGADAAFVETGASAHAQGSATAGQAAHVHAASGVSFAAFLQTGAVDAASMRATAQAVAAVSMEAAIPGLSGMLKGVVDPLMKPVTGALGGAMSDALGDSVGKLLGGLVQSGVTSEVVALLSHSLTSALSESVVPPLTESLSDTIVNTLTPMLRDAVTTAVVEKLTVSLTESVSASLTETISAQLEHDVPDELAPQLSAELTHYLTQSVTQSVVPALTYTLHHSPAEDYFCAYCNSYKLYCDYCRKDGPEQLYRAQHYAAYYSRYYAREYGKQFDQSSPAPYAVPSPKPLK